MNVSVAFAAVTLIWSTTPLGISWSNESLSPFAAVCARMSIAAIAGYFILRLLKLDLVWGSGALKVYGSSLIGVYGAMVLTYMAVQYIPSNLVSIVFALSPMLSRLYSGGGFASEGDFRVFALSYGIAFIGLLIVLFENGMSIEGAWLGVALILGAVNLYSISGVLVEKQKTSLHPFSITVGTLILSVIPLSLTWWVFDGVVPELDWSSKSPYAVLYLALVGSLLGFACYFFVLKSKGAVAVAMVTLMTPAFAVLLGAGLAGEPISVQLVVGLCLIAAGMFGFFRASKWL